jgi:dephospho-CoA kinase
MEQRIDWEKTVRRIELLLRLKSFPVALKMLEKKEALDQIAFLRKPQGKRTLCQLITLVRNFDWTVGAKADDFLSPMCGSIIGLNDTPAIYKDGTFRSIVWVKTKEDGRKYEAAIPRLPLGRYEAVALAPLVYNPFDPDLVLIYANPAQMMLLINALQFEDYEVMQFFCVGESSCSDAIVRALQTGKPALTIPCYGERRYGHAQDEDLIMAIPPTRMPKALRGLEALYRRGIRYPISYGGTEQDLSTAFPPAYHSLPHLEAVRGKDHRLLLGVTGGRATGKSTVVRMLKELGAPVIDFDLLARKVVEPEEPAWRDIVAYFGTQILLEDRNLDRKKLSEIVFGDLEKRKKLEGFTHPRIQMEFIQQLNEIVAKDPEAIIQVDVPLLIESNMSYLFHKILVVSTTAETQVKRLMEREGISREEAATLLKAQLPIEEKVGYADFIIDNNGSLEETRKQVENLWKVLRTIQNEKIIN